MENSTTPHNSAAMPPASDGSVAASVEVYIDKSACGFPESRPLRRPQPTLTDAEREALERNLKHANGRWLMHVSERDQATIGGLLERTK